MPVLCSLNMHAQKIVEALGSAWISKLGFRDVWGMVGQRVIDGASPLEQVHTRTILACWAGYRALNVVLGYRESPKSQNNRS